MYAKALGILYGLAMQSSLCAMEQTAASATSAPACYHTHTSSTIVPILCSQYVQLSKAYDILFDSAATLNLTCKPSVLITYFNALANTQPEYTHFKLPTYLPIEKDTNIFDLVFAHHYAYSAKDYAQTWRWFKELFRHYGLLIPLAHYARFLHAQELQEATFNEFFTPMPIKYNQVPVLSQSALLYDQQHTAAQQEMPHNT